MAQPDRHASGSESSSPAHQHHQRVPVLSVGDWSPSPAADRSPLDRLHSNRRRDGQRRTPSGSPLGLAPVGSPEHTHHTAATGSPPATARWVTDTLVGPSTSTPIGTPLQGGAYRTGTAVSPPTTARRVTRTLAGPSAGTAPSDTAAAPSGSSPPATARRAAYTLARAPSPPPALQTEPNKSETGILQTEVTLIRASPSHPFGFTTKMAPDGLTVVVQGATGAAAEKLCRGTVVHAARGQPITSTLQLDTIKAECTELTLTISHPARVPFGTSPKRTATIPAWSDASLDATPRTSELPATLQALRLTLSPSFQADTDSRMNTGRDEWSNIDTTAQCSTVNTPDSVAAYAKWRALTDETVPLEPDARRSPEEHTAYLASQIHDLEAALESARLNEVHAASVQHRLAAVELALAAAQRREMVMLSAIQQLRNAAPPPGTLDALARSLEDNVLQNSNSGAFRQQSPTRSGHPRSQSLQEAQVRISRAKAELSNSRQRLKEVELFHKDHATLKQQCGPLVD